MSAGQQQAATAPEWHYFNEPGYLASQGAGTTAEKTRKGSTDWLRHGGDAQDYLDYMKASTKPGPPVKMYIRQPEVQRATVRKMTIESQKIYNQLHASLPKPVQKQFTRAKDHQAHTVHGFDHIGFSEIGRMVVLNRDGTRTHVSYRQMNETPGFVADNGYEFRDIPASKRSADMKPMTYVVGRKINKDGTLGELDPGYSKNGQAMVTEDVGMVRKHILAIGKNNLQIMAELEQRERQRAHQQARVTQPAPTGQITSQDQRDAIRAHQATERQQSMAPRPHPHRQREEEAYQPRAYA